MENNNETFVVEAAAGRLEFFWHELWGWITGHCSLGGPEGSQVGFTCEQDF